MIAGTGTERPRPVGHCAYCGVDHGTTLGSWCPEIATIVYDGFGQVVKVVRFDGVEILARPKAGKA